MSLPEEFMTKHMFAHLAELTQHYPDAPIYAELGERLAQTTYPWQILSQLPELINQLIHKARAGQPPAAAYPRCDISADAFIEPGAHIESFVTIKASCYISRGATIRAGAYLREHTFVAPDALVGHSTETKQTLLLAGAKASHHCYVGDSIVGYLANLGAATTTANVRFDRKDVIIHGAGYRNRTYYRYSDATHQTHRHKVGAFFGDHCQTGCQVVTNPGTMILPHAQITPAATQPGAESLAKSLS